MTAARFPRPLLAGLVGLLVQCGSVSGDGPAGASREAIIGGKAVDTPDSPVIYLQGPEGGCTAVLLAPNLVATARHCVASSTTGTFSCTPAGDLVANGSGAGSIGSDDSPGSLGFFSASRVAAGATLSGAPDAVGVQIISTQTSTACRDDLAFVVLDRPVAGQDAAPLRLSSGTRVGELVSVWGYGLTDHLQPLGLRMRAGVPITGVGPDTPPSTTQPAPVRSLRTGPVTCQGDSGGPMMSETTGAVVGIVSLGSQAGTSGPYCATDQLTDTVGPRLAAYHDLILMAFQAAGASPLAENVLLDAAAGPEAAPDGPAPPDSPGAPDSATAPESDGEADAALEPDAVSTPESQPTSLPPQDPPIYRATGASCAIGSGPHGAACQLQALAIALASTAAAVARRRRGGPGRHAA